MIIQDCGEEMLSSVLGHLREPNGTPNDQHHVHRRNLYSLSVDTDVVPTSLPIHLHIELDTRLENLLDRLLELFRYLYMMDCR